MKDPKAGERTLRLMEIVNDISVATADRAPGAFAPLASYLQRVREVLGMDIAFVSRFGGGRRYFEGVSEAPGRALRIEAGASDALLDTYCKMVVEGRLPPIVEDATQLQDTAGMAITARLGIRAYISAPVRLADGSVFGTLCCISHTPRRDLTTRDASALASIAEIVGRSLRRHGTLDPLTTLDTFHAGDAGSTARSSPAPGGCRN